MLSDDEVLALAALGLSVERHYGAPQDIEWAEEGGHWYLVQTRPITTLAQAAPTPAAGESLISGLGASPGIAHGNVRVLRTPDEGSRLVAGEILVAPMTSPDWVPTIRRAAALVTDSGGVTSHAAIVGRELRIPCVVGTRSATQVLRDGELVTVDGSRGRVTAGAPHVEVAAPAVPPLRARELESLATRVYVNLAIADQAEAAAALPVDGVGLLRAEFMITDALAGRHPKELLAAGGAKEFHDKMSAQLLRITRAFHPRPVVYRTYDFRTNEFRGLAGGDKYEPVEDNPMIGFRGCFRYVRDPELFKLELEILARVREETPNLHVMVPFVRTRWELEACLELIEKSPLGRQRGLHRWVIRDPVRDRRDLRHRRTGRAIRLAVHVAQGIHVVRRLVTIGGYGYTEASFLAALKAANVGGVRRHTPTPRHAGLENAFLNSERLQTAMTGAGIRYFHARDA